MQNLLPVVMEIILIASVIHKSRQKVEAERKERAREKNRGKQPWKISVLRLGTRNATGIAKQQR
jgi:hypothetical protein